MIPASSEASVQPFFPLDRTRRSRSFIAILLLLIISICRASTSAHGEERMLFAGFAFAGNYENRLELYPRSAMIKQLRDPNGQPLLNKVFNEKLRRRPEVEARLTGELGRIGIGNQVTAAFALAYENIE